MKLVQSLAVLLTLGISPSSALENEGTKLRGGPLTDLSSEQLQRKLPGPPHKKHSSGSGSGSYVGCLSYSDEELADAWPYWTSSPDCSYDTGDTDEETEPTYDSEDEENRDNGDDSAGGSGSGGNTIITNQDYVNGTDHDPYTGFNVTQCSTYSNLWLWDLAMSCEDESTYEGCNCTFAEELSSMGLLSCDDADQCTDDCPVCKVCMSVLGCDVTDVPPNVLGGGFLLGIDMIYVIAAAAFVTIVIVSSVLLRRRRQQSKEVDGLSVELMSGMSPEEALGKGKAVPVAAFEPPQLLDSTSSYTESVGFSTDIDIESALPSEVDTTVGVVATGMLLDNSTPQEIEDDSTMASQGSEISESAVMFASDMTANMENTSMETSAQPQVSNEVHFGGIATPGAGETENQGHISPCLDTVPSVADIEPSVDEEEAEPAEEVERNDEAGISEEKVEDSQVSEEPAASPSTAPEETIEENQASEELDASPSAAPEETNEENQVSEESDASPSAAPEETNEENQVSEESDSFTPAENPIIGELEDAGDVVTSEVAVDEGDVPVQTAVDPETPLSEEDTPEPGVTEEAAVEDITVANDRDEDTQDVEANDCNEGKVDDELENDACVQQETEIEEDSAEALV
eukprot:Nitzschia sp. Nitz4//scaffold39_size137210//72656//74762//NITZ4_003205-RA/size137210-augustus-gene-0.190-mRNA-1//-1//CDS//3329550401//5309//frame0